MDKKNVILCVDDETAILHSLKRILEPEGYQVFTAQNGEEGLKVLAREKVDLIVTDQRMPVMDGSWFLRAVKKQYPDVVSIMVSGYSDFDALVTALNEGEVYRFLTKPWDNDELKAIIKTALEHRRVTNIIRMMITESCAALGGKVVVDVIEEPNSITARVGEDGAVFSEATIMKFLELIFNAMGTNRKDELKTISGYISRQKGTIVMTIDMGRGMSLKIQVPAG